MHYKQALSKLIYTTTMQIHFTMDIVISNSKHIIVVQMYRQTRQLTPNDKKVKETQEYFVLSF